MSVSADGNGLVSQSGGRPGPKVAELTGMLDLSSWPKGMRVIARRERPHPGAHLRITDIDGHRYTCFATSTRGGQLADLELGHRRRARCEDCIRRAKHTARRWEPRRHRLRLLSAVGRLVRAVVRDGRRLAMGTRHHRQVQPPPGTRARLTSTTSHLQPERTTAGPWNPPGRHGSRNTGPRPRPQATQPRSRKIEANGSLISVHRTNR
jgi:hypothetical protein